MEYKIDVEQYSAYAGIKLSWTDGFEIGTKITGKEIVISANRAGLISLASHLLTLAQDNVPAGAHIHLDQSNSLEEGSTDIIISRR